VATNAKLAYGRDVRAISDADELFHEVSGLELVRQDAIHLITVDDFLGPGGDGLGFNVGKLVGSTGENLQSYGPVISQVLTDDERISTADVFLTETKSASGTNDVALNIQCSTALGPFSIVTTVSELQQAILEGTSI
jgi:hypothetical protein